MEKEPLLKRNDMVAFMTDANLPRVGLVTKTKAESGYVVLYELGQRFEVHVSQVAKLNKIK